jgi:PAB-dependent poly(A)-specific ribonuclease subunit 3
MMVYDFHPNSVNLEEEHLNSEMMALTPRRKSSPPIPERLLWSYITQIANALKAVHSSGMALRGLDPSRILLTGKNRSVLLQLYFFKCRAHLQDPIDWRWDLGYSIL